MSPFAHRVRVDERPEPVNSPRGWIGVDLDGTLAEYDEWRGVDHVGAPIPAMVERVQRWLAEGRDVRIFTARMFSNPATALPPIEKWCEEHLGRKLLVTCVKDFGMIELWDDRVVQVEKNTGRRIGESTRDLDG